MDAAQNTCRQPIAAELLPGYAPICRSIQPATGTTARKVPRLSACLPQCRVDDLGIVRIETDIDGPCLLIAIKHLRPGSASVGRAENTPFSVRAKSMAERRDQDDVRIVRVDYESADLARILETYMIPSLAAVG